MIGTPKGEGVNTNLIACLCTLLPTKCKVFQVITQLLNGIPKICTYT